MSDIQILGEQTSVERKQYSKCIFDVNSFQKCIFDTSGFQKYIFDRKRQRLSLGKTSFLFKMVKDFETKERELSDYNESIFK